MTQDYFKDLKEAPYPLYVAPRPYSFDLNADMLKLIREEFDAEVVASKLADAVKGKAKGEIEKVASALFEELGESWMRRTMQLGEEYSDRTIEMVKESVDRQGKQFLVWPHVPQRFIEIAYLSTQAFLKLDVTLNNNDWLEYRIPQCALFNKIKEKCGDEVANLMTCKGYCLRALETVHRDLDMDVVINMAKSTARDGYCEFSVKRI